MYGYTPTMADIDTRTVQLGRYFTEVEDRHAAEVCLVGDRLVREFFPGADPIGRVVRAGAAEFTVVGTFERIGSVLGQDQDNFLVVPLRTYLKAARPAQQPGSASQGGKAAKQVFDRAQDEARRILRARRHVPPGKDDDFFIGTADTYISLWQSISSAFFTVFVMVARFRPWWEAFVIMNVMLVSVTERTKEIGVRRAVGAHPARHSASVPGRERAAMPGGRRHRRVRRIRLRPGASPAHRVSRRGSDLGGGAGRGFEFHDWSILRNLSGREGVQAGPRGGASGGVSRAMTRAEIKENLLVALDTLRTRKVRSGLTILGIVIGVTSVISVAAIIDGLNGYILNRIRSFGSRSAVHYAYPRRIHRNRASPQNIRMRKYLDISDAQYLKQNVPGLDISAAFAQRINFGQSPDSIRYANEHVERLIIRGTQPEYAAALPLFSTASGRYIPSSTRSTRAAWW